MSKIGRNAYCEPKIIDGKTLKQCSLCFEWKELEHMRWHGKGKRGNICKMCDSARRKKPKPIVLEPAFQRDLDPFLGLHGEQFKWVILDAASYTRVDVSAACIGVKECLIEELRSKYKSLVDALKRIPEAVRAHSFWRVFNTYQKPENERGKI